MFTFTVIVAVQLDTDTAYEIAKINSRVAVHREIQHENRIIYVH